MFILSRDLETKFMDRKHQMTPSSQQFKSFFIKDILAITKEDAPSGRDESIHSQVKKTSMQDWNVLRRKPCFASGSMVAIDYTEYCNTAVDKVVELMQYIILQIINLPRITDTPRLFPIRKFPLYSVVYPLYTAHLYYIAPSILNCSSQRPSKDHLLFI